MPATESVLFIFGQFSALRKFPGPWAERAGTVMVHPLVSVVYGVGQSKVMREGFWKPNSTGASLRGPRPQCWGLMFYEEYVVILLIVLKKSSFLIFV